MISRRMAAAAPFALVLTLMSCGGGKPVVVHGSQAVSVPRPTGSPTRTPTPRAGSGGAENGRPYPGRSSRAGRRSTGLAGNGSAGHTPGEPSSTPHSTQTLGSPVIASNQVEFYA